MTILTTIPASISKDVAKIKKICADNRLLAPRFKALRDAGYSVASKLHTNGGGIGTVVKVKDNYRVRVSSTWAAKKGGTYATVVTL
jgi:hypothetical protein